MNRQRILRLAGAAVGGLVVSGAVILMTASAAGVAPNPFAASPSPNPSAKPGSAERQAWCSAFLGHFASDLGKTQQQVNDAAVKAFGQTVDDAVKAGKLTAQQGTDMKNRAASGSLCSGDLISGHGRIGPEGPGMKAMPDVIAAVASALGLTADQLKQDLMNGQKVSDLAAAKGYKDEASFRTAVIANVKTDLDAKVKSGAITQAQEDSILQHLQNMPIPGWNGQPQRPAGPRGSHPAPSGSPSTT